MRNEGFPREILYRNAFSTRKSMSRSDDQLQLVVHDRDSFKRVIIRFERNNPKFDLACSDLFWNTACHAPLDLDLYHRVPFAKFCDQGQQIKHRVLVCADRDLASMQI